VAFPARFQECLSLRKPKLALPLVLTVLVLVLHDSQLEAVQSYQPVFSDPALEPWRWRSFPELKGHGLRCLAESRDGAMWFGTDEGVWRYDGLHWTVYTREDGLIGAPVNALCATRDGSVWAGTEMGISRFREGTWSRVFPAQEELPWPIDEIRESRDGSIWAATAWGALHLRPHGSLLYTSEEMGAALRVLAPGVPLFPVADKAVPVRSWGEGTWGRWKEGAGIEVVKGAFLSTYRGSVPMIVWALAPGGPGVAAGLEVGDGILAVDGDLPMDPYFVLDGPAGTSVKLLIKRKGRSQPFEVTLTRERVEGRVRGFSVSDVYEDREGRMWFALSWGGEIVRAPIESTGEWELYTEADGLGTGSNSKLAQTRDGAMWVISNDSEGGVNRFDGQAWTHFRLSAMRGNDVNTSILETRDGALWIGEHMGRLHIFRNGVWTVYWPSEVPVPQTRIIGLLEASDGGLWIAGLGQEAVRLEHGKNRWATYEGLTFQCETGDGSIWFVDGDSSAVRFDGERWVRYGEEDGLIESPRALISTREGVVWAAGSHFQQAATARFDPAAAGDEGGEPWSMQLHPHLSRALDNNAVFQSSDGSVWFGAVDVGSGQVGGVLRFHGQQWKHYTRAEALLTSYAMGETFDGMLWFGGPPLRRFDGKVWKSITEPKGLATWVHDMCVTDDGDLWVSTRSYGVYRFDGETWKQYGVRDGLADNQVDAILQTADGSIWAASPKGFSRFDGRTWVAHALSTDIRSEGLRGGLRQSRDGALWINSPNRTIRYQPDTDPPDTEVELPFDEITQPGNITVIWRGLDPWKATPDGELQYAWRLDGGKWSPFSPERSHLFLLLSSGDHLLEVKARDRDFNEDPSPAAVRFTVTPPVWKQPWFLTMMFFWVGIIAFLAIRMEISRRDRNRALRERNQALEEANERLREADQLKSDFVSLVSHELRTPLTSIKGAVDNMVDGIAGTFDERQNRYLQRIQTNADRLARLINDLLDLSRIEAGNLELQRIKVSVGQIARDVVETLQPMVIDDGIKLHLEAGEPHLQALGDPDRVHQILLNLTANAVKFTQAGGQVEIEIAPKGKFVYTSVRDTGVGFPTDQLERVFEEFYQAGGEVAERKGVGLGLAIARRLVELHGGQIWAESKVGEGSTFWFTLPLA